MQMIVHLYTVQNSQIFQVVPRKSSLEYKNVYHLLTRMLFHTFD